MVLGWALWLFYKRDVKTQGGGDRLGKTDKIKARMYFAAQDEEQAEEVGGGKRKGEVMQQ